jgi:uncharacterized protein
MTIQEKEKKLEQILTNLQSVSIAFSGGVDSTFLLYKAKQMLNENVRAYTIQTPYIPAWEIEEAKELAQKIGVAHEIVEIEFPENIRYNPENRCYLCKTQLFNLLKTLSQKQNMNYLCEGTNADDLKDYRPGRKAIEELNVKSPLLDAELSKNEIRELSKKGELSTWIKPAYACLLTRIPYDAEVTLEILRRIEKAEKFLIDKNIKEVRVRTHNKLARIETTKENMKVLIEEPIARLVENYFKSIGYDFVCIDISGYKTGSFNFNL